MNNNPDHHEIIIIKRINIEEDGHHGGAWKIAFADFMTAMMALFLVLWLINAANEETKRSVASYFNPVKLVDRNRSTKGINDQRGGPTSELNESGAAIPKEQLKTNNPKNEAHEQVNQSALEIDSMFFASPMQKMEEIVAAAEEAPMLLGSAPTPQPDAVVESFADPFGPDFWNKTKGGDESNAVASGEGIGPFKKDRNTEQKEPSSTMQKIDEQQVAALKPIAKSEVTAFEQDKVDSAQKKMELAEQLQKSVKNLLIKDGPSTEKLSKMIEIKSVEEGILFSVTDDLDVPIFKVGSAIPEASLILAVEAIAKSLKDKLGAIRVHGHTDGREYKNIADGNWRLSTDRAKATYFMLLRGGLVDQRIVEIAGFADRKLRTPENPLADQNRRIEILLETK